MGDVKEDLKAEIVDYLADVVFDRNYPIHPGIGFDCLIDSLEYAGASHVFDVDDPSKVHFCFKRRHHGRIDMNKSERKIRDIVPRPTKYNIRSLTPHGLSSARVSIIEELFGIGEDGQMNMDLESQDFYAMVNSRFNARFSESLRYCVRKHQENALVSVDLKLPDLSHKPGLIEGIVSAEAASAYDKALRMDFWGSSTDRRICPSAKEIAHMGWGDFEGNVMPHAHDISLVLKAELIRRLGDSDVYYYEGNPHPQIDSIIDMGVEALVDSENTPWGY